MDDNYPVYDYDPNNLPDEALAALGLVATSSCHTEYAVQSAIAGCLSLTPDYANALTTHMNSPVRDHALRALAEIKINDINALNELDKILDQIVNSFKIRNDYMHYPLVQKDGNLFLAKITARGSVKAELLPKTISGIRKDAKMIYDSGILLHAFCISHDLIPPIPDFLPSREHKTKSARKNRRNNRLN